MARALALTAGFLAATLTGCSPFGGGRFNCEQDTQCNAVGGDVGRCMNGLCAYPNPSCQDGYSYGDNSGNQSGDCVGGGGDDDGGGDASDNRVCIGADNGLVRPCFPARPTGDVMLAGMINTTDDPRCSQDVTNADGLCVIAGDRILVNASVTAIGTRPLVLVAGSTIEISARLDVASHHSTGANPPYTSEQIGAGSGPTACAMGVGPTNGGTNDGGGGGAGGTFGGTGGTGGGASNATGGMPGAKSPVTALRGGCHGQNGIRGALFGLGGHGGGAVYLIADTSIRISSAINASGEGGLPGLTGAAGGGGGGSGGMIGLDSPMIMNTGAVFANGGSGGEGSNETARGDPGPEATGIAAASPPLGNTAEGGDGGGGGAGSTPNNGDGLPGLVGAGGMNDGGGGGGGGGAGVIKVYRGTLGGNVSPTPMP